MYIQPKGSSQATTSITLPLEEYQSMLDEMKKLKEDNSKLCRGANIIKVFKVNSLFSNSYDPYNKHYHEDVDFGNFYSDDLVDKFRSEVEDIVNYSKRLENELIEKNNKISELYGKGSLNLLTFVVGCFVGALVMYFQ